eukprot:2393760-Prymnesium_polylepis.1
MGSGGARRAARTPSGHHRHPGPTLRTRRGAGGAAPARRRPRARPPDPRRAVLEPRAAPPKGARNLHFPHHNAHLPPKRVRSPSESRRWAARSHPHPHIG